MVRPKQHGFLSVESILALLVLLLIAGAAYVVVSKQNDALHNKKQPAANNQQTGSQPHIQNWPVTIAALNASSKLAGDVYMDDRVLISGNTDLPSRPVTEVGRQAQRSVSSDMTFLVRSGAPVYAVADGSVVSVEHVQQNGRDDYTVRLSPAPVADGQTSAWVVTYGHVIDVTVVPHAHIRAGDRLGAAGPYGAGQPYSVVTMQVTHAGEAYCPSFFITSSARQRMKTALLQLTEAWETQAVNGGVYNESAWTAIGCMADKVKS